MVHREEFLMVAHLTHDTAMIAWGAFFFEQERSEADARGFFDYKLLDDDDLRKKDRMKPWPVRRNGSIGQDAESYGAARVRIRTADTDWEDAWSGSATHCTITGLSPNTRYWYQVEVEGTAWGQAPRTFIVHDFNRGKFRDADAGQPYLYSFQTFPLPDQPTPPFTFAIIGDPGTGQRAQLLVARALVDCVERENIRFLLTTGDNIYMQGSLIQKAWGKLSGRTRMSGDEDDDWFTAFFLPYGHVLNRMPVFPSIGNHDSVETEEGDDLGQMLDNFYLPARFPEFAKKWGLGQPGPDAIFYRFRFGRDVEFVAVDTSFTEHASEHQTWGVRAPGDTAKQPPLLSPQHQEFVADTLRKPAALRFVYGHHPAFCVGPNHPDTPLVQRLAREFADESELIISIAGHEHNFQHHFDGRLHYILSGAAGKCSEVPHLPDPPANLCCHWSEPHFLLVKVDGEQVTVRAINGDGEVGQLVSTCNRPEHPNHEIAIARIG